jgi:hypothetical protein
MANADSDSAAANDTAENRLLAMMLGVAGTQLIDWRRNSTLLIC